MTTTHDYKAALDSIDISLAMGVLRDGETLRTIRHALLIADKLMQEPSEEVRYEGHCKWDQGVNAVFKAMRDQMLKEIK